MNITDRQAEKLLTGNTPISQLGFSLLVTRLRTAYAKDRSPASLQHCVEAINAYVSRFSAVLDEDRSKISRL